MVVLADVYFLVSCSVGIVSSGSGLFDVDAIVLDEVHYLSDISRGTVWEEIVGLPSLFSFSTSLAGWFCFGLYFELQGLCLGYLLPQRSSTYLFVSNSCKSR